MSKIQVTGNESIDDATAEIAIALRNASPGYHDQHYYDKAMRLRDAIMRGARIQAAGPVFALLFQDEVLEMHESLARLEAAAEGDSNDDEIEAGQDCAEHLERLLARIGYPYIREGEGKG